MPRKLSLPLTGRCISPSPSLQEIRSIPCLNGFAGFYEQMACLYFARPEAQSSSRAVYTALHAAARRGDAAESERCPCAVMQESIGLWRQRGGRG